MKLNHYMIVLTINIIYIGILVGHPKSELYHIWEKDDQKIFAHYTKILARILVAIQSPRQRICYGPLDIPLSSNYSH